MTTKVEFVEMAKYSGPFSERMKKRDDCKVDECGATHICRRCFYASTGVIAERAVP